MDKSIVKKAKSNSLATKVTVLEALDRQLPGFVDAVPKGFDAERFVRVCKTVVRENTALQQCDIQSLLGSLMISAQLGLEPNTTLAEAHIIPYGNKAQFQMGYRGLIKLAWNSGHIVSIDYDKICENDTYEYSKGDGGTLKHTPLLTGDRGNTVAYYAFALMKTGAKAVHLMTLQEVQDHGKRFSKAYNDKTSPWKTDFDAMAYKTVLIQLADKKLPKATQTEAMMLLAQSVQRDSTNPLLPEEKIGVAIDMDEIIDDTDYDMEVHTHPMGAGFAHKDVKAPEKKTLVKAKPKVEVKPEPVKVVEKKEGFVPQSKRQQEIPA